MKRKIIKIDEDKCNGCELCIPNCPEGAIQIIDGKARLISDLCCDGLGACLGHCPEGAIEIIEREAEAYDERKVIENIILQGINVVKTHLEHLQEHNEKEFLNTALNVLKEKGIENPMNEKNKKPQESTCGCPGAAVKTFNRKPDDGEKRTDLSEIKSELTHWPIQLHLISPLSKHFIESDLLLVADCVPFAFGNFHQKFLKNHVLTIACPKLDEEQEIYLEKLVTLIDEAKVNTITVLIMQVPCCGGLSQLVKAARDKAKRNIPIKEIIVGLEGSILREEWL